jgi:hypothetical protein
MEQVFEVPSRQIDWKSIDEDFASYYADIDHPAVPVRLG